MYKNYADILPTAISSLFVRNDVYHDHYTYARVSGRGVCSIFQGGGQLEFFVDFGIYMSRAAKLRVVVRGVWDHDPQETKLKMEQFRAF